LVFALKKLTTLIVETTPKYIKQLKNDTIYYIRKCYIEW